MADEPPPLDVEGSPPPPGDEELSEDNIFGKPLLDEPEPAKEERKEKKGKGRNAARRGCRSGRVTHNSFSFQKMIFLGKKTTKRLPRHRLVGRTRTVNLPLWNPTSPSLLRCRLRRPRPPAPISLHPQRLPAEATCLTKRERRSLNRNRLHGFVQFWSYKCTPVV